jgi:hypothetical protein
MVLVSLEHDRVERQVGLAIDQVVSEHAPGLHATQEAAVERVAGAGRVS